MNKQELIGALREKTGMEKKAAETFLNAFTDVVRETLAAGDKIALPGFGSFEVAVRSGRTGRNPATGKEIEIPASKVAKFKAGKVLKDAING